MKIECIQRRQGGTRVTLRGSIYHFAPRVEDGRHVCEIENEDHIGALLRHPEGYRIAPKTVREEARAERVTQPAEALQVDPTPSVPVVPMGATSEPAPAGVVALDDMSDEHLATVYEAEIGRKPHARAKRETMIAQIEEARAERK